MNTIKLTPCGCEVKTTAIPFAFVEAVKPCITHEHLVDDMEALHTAVRNDCLKATHTTQAAQELAVSKGIGAEFDVVPEGETDEDKAIREANKEAALQDFATPVISRSETKELVIELPADKVTAQEMQSIKTRVDELKADWHARHAIERAKL